MAKQPKTTEELPEDAAAASKAKSARKLLIAAVVLSVASLGAGFFLAKTAFQEDSAAYEPTYVEGEDGEEGQEVAAADGDTDTKLTDPLAKDGHPAEDAVALQDKPEEKDDDADEEGKDGEEVVKDDGVLEFADILANINGFNAEGKPTRGFLKLRLVMIYRPDPGSQALMEERQPFMRDLFNGYARSLTEIDLRGMAGIVSVKAELLKRARAAAGNDLPQEILISDLIVQ